MINEIEERAKQYTDNSLYDNSVTRKQYSYRGYVRGAIEQQKVDIEKFVKWCERFNKDAEEIGGNRIDVDSFRQWVTGIIMEE